MTQITVTKLFLRGLACLALAMSSAFGVTYQIPHGGPVVGRRIPEYVGRGKAEGREAH